jgi:hypothetical protein
VPNIFDGVLIIKDPPTSTGIITHHHRGSVITISVYGVAQSIGGVLSGLDTVNE